MSTEIEKPLDLAELLREKIKSAFIETIPEPAWDKLIEGEWQRFTTTRGRHGYAQQSPLSEMVEEAIRSVVKEEIDKALKQYFEGSPVQAELLSKEAIQAAIPGVIEAFMRSIIEQTVMSAQRATQGY